MINVNGIGLGLTENDNSGYHYDADNSGPYSNLYISLSGTGSPGERGAACVSILGDQGTRGIHGLTCTTSAANTAALRIDGYNNTLEDISIYGGFTNGTLLGSRASSSASANSNTMLNVSGDGYQSNLIHIQCSNCSTGGPVGTSLPTNQTIVGISNPTSSNATIKDDLTNTTLHDSFVGMYLVGDPTVATAGTSTTVIGYSRFTTSVSQPAPTWLVGPTAPSQNGSCPAPGDLYSNTGLGDTLWACDGNGAGWQFITSQ